MAKTRTQFVCQNCGTVHARWAGRCDGCGAWNTIVEDDPNGGIGGQPGAASARKGRPVALATLSGEAEEAPRVATGISELDRATGGGFVRGTKISYLDPLFAPLSAAGYAWFSLEYRMAGSGEPAARCTPPRYRCHLGCILLKMPATSCCRQAQTSWPTLRRPSAG